MMHVYVKLTEVQVQSTRTIAGTSGVLLDYDETGRPVGIEITAALSVEIDGVVQVEVDGVVQ